jgi:protein involved in polysaccharide export with SLBB domain
MSRLYSLFFYSFIVFLTACSLGPRLKPTDAAQEYRLSGGDKLLVRVFGEETLSGPFQVDSRPRGRQRQHAART